MLEKKCDMLMPISRNLNVLCIFLNMTLYLQSGFSLKSMFNVYPKKIDYMTFFNWPSVLKLSKRLQVGL